MWFSFRVSYNAPLVFDEATVIEIQKGDTLSKFTSHLGSYDKTMMKLWLRNHKDQIPKLQEGKYRLSGSYGKEELLQLIDQGPQQDYIRLTLLE